MTKFEVSIKKEYRMTIDAETENEAEEKALNLIEHGGWQGEVFDTWIQSQV